MMRKIKAKRKMSRFDRAVSSTLKDAEPISPEPIAYVTGDSVFGAFMMAASPTGVVLLSFGDASDMIASFENGHPNTMFREADVGSDLKKWALQLKAYLAGEGAKPDVSLDLRGTDLQLAVWRQLCALKPNETLSYSELAHRAGAPKAVRAVASACAKNRIAILVPCHQVVTKSGQTGSYRWGSEMKASLIARGL